MAFIGKTPAPVAFTSQQISDGIITTAKLANSAVTSAKVADGAVVTADIADSAVTAGKLASTLDLTGKTVTLPAGVGGKVLQVVSATKTDTFSTASTSFVDVTGFSVSITPTSATSKILVFGNLTSSAGLTAVITGYAQLVRDSTAIGNGSSGLATHNSANSSFTVGWPFSFLDSPATTSATTYKVQVKGDGATFYINTPSARTLVGSSTITVMEIAA